MPPRWLYPAILCISNSLFCSWCGAAEDRLEGLLADLQGEDLVSREIAESRITALGTSRASDLAAALTTVEDRDARVRLERSFRRVVLPLMQAWRAAVTPVPAGSDAGRVERANRAENQLRQLGPPVWPLFHRLRVCGTVVLAREAKRYLEAEVQRTPLPGDQEFTLVRYLFAPGLVLLNTPRARSLLAEHLRLTVEDLAGGTTVVKNRAEEELCLLGDGAGTYLDGVNVDDVAGLSVPELDRVKRSVSWGVWPELRARTGLTMEGWDRLPWREQVLLVSLWKRVAGEDAIPLLRRIQNRATEEAVRERAILCLFDLEAIEGQLPHSRPVEALRVLIIWARQLRERGEVDRALELLWQVVEKLPKDRDARYQLAFTLHVAKRYEEAIEEFQKTLAIEGADRSLDYLAWYNMACAYALAGRPTESIDALYAAIEAGYRDRQHLEVDDPDLESLREPPEFEKVLDALEKAQAED